MKTNIHPCFSESGHLKYARMHLPVAPKCNIQCNYCNRKYDCMNESRPGVTSEVLTPQQAFEKYKIVKQKIPNLTVVGFAGPGDALANFSEVSKTVDLIREYDPEVCFCLSTNGLALPFYADELVKLGITHLTITINTVNPKVGVLIYSRVNPEILLENQLKGLEMAVSKGMTVKVNIVAIKDINDNCIEEVVKKAKELGAYKTNIMQLIPAEGTVFQDRPIMSNKELNEIRKKCSIHLKQMYHCQQCRADAIGMLSQDRSIEFRNVCSSRCTPENSKKLVFAAASESGEFIDQHFGKAENFTIYEYSDNQVKKTGIRPLDKYCTGIDDCDSKNGRFSNVLNALKGCDGVISLRIGAEPRKMLQENNIKSFEIYNKVEEAVKQAAELYEKEETYAKT